MVVVCAASTNGVGIVHKQQNKLIILGYNVYEYHWTLLAMQL